MDVEPMHNDRVRGSRRAPCPGGVPPCRPRQGFTLLELLMVFVIISIVAAVAIPLLRRSQVGANEVAAMKALRTIHDCQLTFYMTYRKYGTLTELGPAGRNYLIDPALASGTRSGYRFDVVMDTDSTWHAVCTPVDYSGTGMKTFYIDESHVLRGSDLGRSELVARAVAETWPVQE